MNKKDLLFVIVTGVGLSLIFGVASHNWTGIICGIFYVFGYIIANYKNKK